MKPPLAMAQDSFDELLRRLVLVFCDVVNDEQRRAVDDSIVSFDMQFSVPASKHFPYFLVVRICLNDVGWCLTERAYMNPTSDILNLPFAQ